MTIPLRQVLEGRKPPICIREEQSIKEALALMLGNNVNQLPVVDDTGQLKGVISEQSVLQTYYHSAGKVSLLSLPVSHCQEEATTLSLDDDLLDTLALLNDRDNHSVILVEEQRPVAILTNYDMTNFFREVSEGQIFVENVELTLRHHIETVFPSEEALQVALMVAFGPDRFDKEKPARDYHYLGFLDHVKLITHDDNWPKFQGVFEPKELFWALMDQVRLTRNQLAHFRGRPDALQYNGLRVAIDWLATRPKLQPQEAQEPAKGKREKAEK